MGQRLNISIEKDGMVLANAYYHWSAYTKTALELLKTILEVYEQMPITSSDLELAVRLLESTGAGINLKEHERILKDERFYSKTYISYRIPMRFMTSIDRNYGIISITPEGIKETEDWAEGRVVIDIGTETVLFSVYWESSVKEYKEEFPDAPILYSYYFDFLQPIPFNEIQRLENAIEHNEYGFIYDDYAYLWIE